MIRFEKVGKVYGNVQTLSNISFTVGKGELVALIGPSGCGKTTTLRMVNRLIEPTSGKILIQDKDISNIDPVELRRGIGYVIQQIGLLPHMTIGKNIALVPRIKGCKEKDYSKRIDELLDLVGLDPKIFRNRYPSELSGGQQQRIGVIRALAAEPPIVLMDEPFSALDPISREQLQDELVRIQKEIHKTIVFVTHDMDEALKIADRIAIMHDGKIVQLDTPEAILNQPVNDFVKDFIGEKRLRAKVESTDSTITLEDVMIHQKTKVTSHHSIAEVLTFAKDADADVLMITDQDYRFAGMVSLLELERNAHKGTESVSTIMNTVVPPLEFTSSWKEAAKHLIESGTKGVPVIKHGQAVGILTETSIVRSLAK
jgi:osmoprotectant transport system ATP-binding protein